MRELETVAEREVITEGGERPWLGRHRISRGHSDLWLQFADEGGLKSVILARPDNLQTMRLSPRRNLCTGELTFRLRILLPAELLGATAYLDGERTATLDDLQEDFELTIGQHLLRIEKEDHEPIIKNLQLGTRDRGDQRLDLTEVDLWPIQKQSEQ
ncbi:MAG TPA: hypothetical protein VKK31_25500 [Thermoanaerobaculia bacterium]|nr:hypothetical protein [Thermoanaerobaculia bacterium]